MITIAELMRHSKREAVWNSICQPLSDSVRGSLNNFKLQKMSEPVFIVTNSLYNNITFNIYDSVKQYE